MRLRTMKQNRSLFVDKLSHLKRNEKKKNKKQKALKCNIYIYTKYFYLSNRDEKRKAQEKENSRERRL